MATRRQPLIPGWLIPGVSATTLVVAVALAAFLALWWNAPQDDWVAVWQDSYLWHVVRFSFWQAFLSALLSVIPAIFLARALYRRRFPGRLALLRLCAMTLILPVLVAVFGILSVYGRQGWLASLWQSLGLEAGAQFSFNDVVGERTAEAGYDDAPHSCGSTRHTGWQSAGSPGRAADRGRFPHSRLSLT